MPLELGPLVDSVSNDGATPLVVTVQTQLQTPRILGVIRLKDTVKPGVTGRFDQMRSMGVRTVMITGDNASQPQRSHANQVSTTSSRRPPPRTRWP